MKTPWIEEKDLAKRLERHEAFWNGELENGPLLWVTAGKALAGQDLPVPDEEEKMWTDVEYLMAWAENELSRTYFAGDSLPVFTPTLGPDQFAAWLGAELTIKPSEYTSWSKPFVDDWSNYPNLTIDPDNRWWKLYWQILNASVEVGKDKWVTAYPDLHTGIDALGAIRGPENLMMDMAMDPEPIHRAMGQLTELWKTLVDKTSEVILPTGQGTSNWCMGWSSKRYLCLGQNDYSCLISPQMFDDFCWNDNLQTSSHVDCSLYHLDGPDAVRHLPKILELEKLNCVQWIQGAGNPHPSQWLDLLQQIQAGGKSIQLCYIGDHGTEADIFKELEILCEALDPNRLFFWIGADTKEQADAIIKQAKK